MQIVEVHEEINTCDRQGCKRPVSAYFLFRFGAVGLCKSHAAEHVLAQDGASLAGLPVEFDDSLAQHEFYLRQSRCQ